MEIWELIARESIRDRIARWNANGDAGRFADMVQVLAPDVEFTPTPDTVIHGRDAVLEYLGGVGAGTPPDTSGRYVPDGGRPSLRHFTSTIQIDLVSERVARGAVLLPGGVRNRPRSLGSVPRRIRCRRR